MYCERRGFRKRSCGPAPAREAGGGLGDSRVRTMQALFGEGDPKATVRKWKSEMRSEQRVLDRQIRGARPRRHMLRALLAACHPPRRVMARSERERLPMVARSARVAAAAGIQREEQKTKKSIKDAAKRGDTASAKLLAKEICRARKAVTRLHTSKAQMNSVVMQMENQLGACWSPRAARAPTRAQRGPRPPARAVLTQRGPRSPRRTAPMVTVATSRRPRAIPASHARVPTPAAQQKLTGTVKSSTEVMKMMNRLTKVSEVSAAMQNMQKEMMKVRTPPPPASARLRPPPRRGGRVASTRARHPGRACKSGRRGRAEGAQRAACPHLASPRILSRAPLVAAGMPIACRLHADCMRRGCNQAGVIEEMVDDAMDVLDEDGDEEAADEEVERVLTELNAEKFSNAASAPSRAVVTEQQADSGAAAAADEDDDEEEMSAMRERLAQIKS